MRAAEVWAAVREVLREGEVCLLGHPVSWQVEADSAEVEASGYTLRWWRDSDGGWCGDCDRKLCEEHRTVAGDDVDLCPFHGAKEGGRQ